MTYDQMFDWLSQHREAYAKAGDVRNRQQAWAIEDAIRALRVDAEKLERVRDRAIDAVHAWQHDPNGPGVLLRERMKKLRAEIGPDDQISASEYSAIMDESMRDNA